MTRERDEPSKVEGKTQEWKGKAKQAAGDLTDDPRQRMEGRSDEKLGESEQTRAELRDEERKDRRV